MKRIFIYFSRIFIFPFIKNFIKEINGKENLPSEGNFIMASNHLSNLDNWMIMCTFKERLKKTHFLGAKEGWIGAVKNTILYYFSETVAVDRKHVKREKILNKLQGILEKGRIVIIYPEGISNTSTQLLKGKTGVAELALKTGKPVIPIGIEMEKKSKHIIRIGKPIYFLKEKELFSQLIQGTEGYHLILREVTDRIMKEISILSKKPYNFNYEN